MVFTINPPQCQMDVLLGHGMGPKIGKSERRVELCERAHRSIWFDTTNELAQLTTLPKSLSSSQI